MTRKRRASDDPERHREAYNRQRRNAIVEIPRRMSANKRQRRIIPERLPVSRVNRILTRRNVLLLTAAAAAALILSRCMC